MITGVGKSTDPLSVRVLIICAGQGTRWEGYLGTEKHLVEIEGERLLDRTVRLLSEQGVGNVCVVTKEYDERYNVLGTSQEVVCVDYENNVDADKFLSSKHLWHKAGRTIVLYGDCYFTDQAMEVIVHFPKREWTLFCRPGASKLTGTNWGECFAQSFYPEHLSEHEKKLRHIVQLKQTGKINRCGGWEHYRAMTGQKNLDLHALTTNYVVIDDWTEDFDYPRDYQIWMRNRDRWRKNPPPAPWE